MPRVPLARPAVVILALTTLPFALSAVIDAVARKPLDEGAREEFSRIHSCPPERVELRPRADLTAWDLHVAKWGRRVPPEEVARDPERLALWTQSERESQERENADSEVFEVRGCGIEVLWACDHPGMADGGVALDLVSCENGAYPEGSRKPW